MRLGQDFIFSRRGTALERAVGESPKRPTPKRLQRLSTRGRHRTDRATPLRSGRPVPGLRRVLAVVHRETRILLLPMRVTRNPDAPILPEEIALELRAYSAPRRRNADGHRAQGHAVGAGLRLRPGSHQRHPTCTWQNRGHTGLAAGAPTYY